MNDSNNPLREQAIQQIMHLLRQGYVAHHQEIPPEENLREMAVSRYNKSKEFSSTEPNPAAD